MSTLPPTPPVEAEHERRWYTREARLYVVMVAVLYLGFGASMLLQPLRWQRTPAYHNLFVVLPETVWGVIFCAVAVVMMLGVFRFPRNRGLRLMSLGMAVALTLAWLLAFLIRWLTSDATTPETWGSFAVNLALLIQASRVLDGDVGP